MLLPLPPIKNIQYQLCQFYWFLVQIRQTAAAADKLQKERIMLLMITLHHLNSETPLFLKDKSTVIAERSNYIQGDI